MAEDDDWRRDEDRTRHDGSGMAEEQGSFASVVSLDQHRLNVDSKVNTGSPATQEKIRVLIVEDDEDDFLITRELLERAETTQYRIEWANGVETGLKRLAAGCFDICLVDYRLPGRTGLELVRIAQRRGFELPMILISGMAEDAIDMTALDLGVEDFIDKEEFDTDRLDRAVRFALARRRALTRYGKLAQFDDLTGLANRALFRNRLDRALANARRRRNKLAVMFLDLNDFKAVNDTHGHQLGDKLLAVVAERLTARLRETDTIARLGGDEFAILVEDLQKSEFAGVVARKVLDVMATPIQVDEIQLRLSTALGVALFPEDGMGAEELVQLADAAMYAAKRDGGNRCRFHDPAFDGRMRHGALIGADLRRAIDQDALTLLFQPQVTLGSNEIGLASIIQWRHAELGEVGLEHFRNLAEDSGSIEPLIDWLIGKACQIAKQWHLASLGPLHLSVPIMSRRQLAWASLGNRIASLLRAHELPPSWIELEIDERLLIEELEAGGAAFKALKASGVRIAVAGFGTAGTSLMVLRDVPVSTVKLAKDFLSQCPQDQHRTLFVASVIALAKQLGLRVVAEGVEDQPQLQMLRSEHCDAMQSIMGCAPLPYEACTRWLERAGKRLDFAAAAGKTMPDKVAGTANLANEPAPKAVQGLHLDASSRVSEG